MTVTQCPHDEDDTWSDGDDKYCTCGERIATWDDEEGWVYV